MAGPQATEAVTSAGRVYEQLRLMAVTYGFRPGLRINEVELSKRLDVSRTPLREALNRLASEGYVLAVPNRGFLGRLLDVTEIMALYEFRCALEQAIMRIVCERASDEELQELLDYAKATAQLDGPVTVATLQQDEEFHLRIARLTKNAEFVRTLENITGRIHFARWIDLRQRGLKRNAHVQLARLLQARDTEKCVAHAGKTISRRHEEILAVIRTGAADIYLGEAVAAN